MKIEKLEAIRGFVAIYIVLHHIVAFNHLQNEHLVLKLIFMHPQEAVLLFFLLSGFVIYLSAANSKNLSFYKYIKKRFVRIYPITLAALAISTIIFLINGGRLTFFDLKVLAGNIFMLQDDQLQPGYIVPAYLKNFPLWSLSYEWWFYVMFFPLFTYLQRKRSQIPFPHVYIILCICLIGWFLFLITPNYFFLVITYFLLWWTGVACAEVYLIHKDFTFKNLLPVFVSLLIMFVFLSMPIIYGYFFKHQTLSEVNAVYRFTTYWHYYLDALLFLLIGLIWWKCHLKGFDIILKRFKIFASISFAVYIIHFPFIWLNIPFIHNFYLLYLTKIVLILLTSYLLEIKMQPLANRLFNNRGIANSLRLEKQAF
ncbi:acyltransferase family protein [Segetibacter koreensis]|uniref:acyltransferase family protein n=1 Tax=Segetibacter koreensis TaxID=398037 RepID=UPI0003601B8C|nr:acyltransferase [Segetibacter koreensis]